MADEFILKIQQYIDDNLLLEKGDNVVMGVSGGADSVALFLTLFSLRERYDLKLFVVHVNHGIRKEAKDEAAYVKDLCEERNIPFYLKEADVCELAKELSMGTEEAGRKVRYEFFEEILSRVGGGKIAVAHNKNDLTETLLFNLFRGTGVKGLASIPPKRGNIIRPLLNVERSEIEAFLIKEKVSFCTDSSNFSDEYSRNRIRNTVIPVIKENVTNQAVEHMANTAEQLRELQHFLEVYCDRIFEDIVVERTDNEVVYLKTSFQQQDICIQKLLVKKAIDSLVPHNRDITHLHLESVIKLCGKDGTKTVNLPYGIVAESSYDRLKLSLDREEKRFDIQLEVKIDETVLLPDGTKVTVVMEECHGSYEYGENQYTKCFDYDKMNRPLMLRTRQSGDEIAVNKEGGKKKLKDFMIDIKIPATKRDEVLLLAGGSSIYWAIGYRMSESAKITENTKRVLKVIVSKEE